MRAGVRVFFSAALLASVLFSCSNESGSNAPSVTGEGLSEGDVAPDFELPSAAGGDVQLSDYRKTLVLLYFSMGPG